MQIVIIGAGGVGGYFGGKLAAAGFDTSFLVRGKTLEAIKSNGLRVKSISGDFHVHPAASDNYDIIKTADLIILSVKSWQIDDIAKKIKPLMNENTVVLPLQNGADNANRLTKIVGSHHVLAGLCRIVAKIDSPGIIDHFGYEPEVLFGEIDNSKSARVELIHSIFTKAGFKNKISDDIQRDIWLKFLFIASISAMGALTRSVLGVMREDSYIRSVLIKTAREIVLVGQRLGINIHEQDIENCFAIIDKIDYQTTMSLQRDMMQEKPSELDNFNGYIVQQGDLLKIDTPVNDFIYYSLKPMENAARNLRM
ncbi:ketopantoate reductase family protein [Lutimonas sp.]|uniref:ketopantoate reductase family protein n=1 Tax=Lutimonas sp. TaxID=1872403 RepID=UPI003D9AECB7